MSAFGGKPDSTFCRNSLSRSLLGLKRTCLFALHMSAFDPKRTSIDISQSPHLRKKSAPTKWRVRASLKIDHEIVFGRLKDWQIGWLRAFEDLPHVSTRGSVGSYGTGHL